MRWGRVAGMVLMLGWAWTVLRLVGLSPLFALGAGAVVTLVLTATLWGRETD